MPQSVRVPLGILEFVKQTLLLYSVSSVQYTVIVI